ncbi:manganese and iron superoxide dismutase, partial [Rhizodiscina lignyota]
IHSIPQLTNGQKLKDEGIPGLYGPAAFDLAWTQPMHMALRKLNGILPDTDKNLAAKDLVIKYARDPENASIFNYASMLHNTHFFFDGLNSTGSPVTPSRKLVDEISNSFGSYDDFRIDFLTTANSMFGPGFVWLVRLSEPNMGATQKVFKVLSTYCAGTPYAGAHYRQQPVDMNTQAVRDAVERKLSSEEFRRQHTIQNTVGYAGKHSQQPGRVSKGGVEVTPVLCVSTWEHAYLMKFGVDGKRGYLKEFWHNINWDVVEHRCGFEVERQLSSDWMQRATA